MLSVFFAFPLRFLTSFEEKFFLRCAVLFFLYTILLSVCVNGISFYPFFGLLSMLWATLIGILFYVSVRENYLSRPVLIYFWAVSSAFVIIPLLLVQLDAERFVRLSEEYGANNILYGYANPRALGWVSTICL
jgi:hypothetical protein